MVDNPTKFIVFVAVIILLLTLTIMSFQSKQNNPKNNSDVPSSTSNKVEGVSQNPSSYDAIVRYGDNGFVPATIEIKSGEKIRFKNESKNLMQISTAGDKEEASYGDFTQERPIPEGYFFDLTFSKKGAWFYQNLNDKSKTGIVIVK